LRILALSLHHKLEIKNPLSKRKLIRFSNHIKPSKRKEVRGKDTTLINRIQKGNGFDIT